MKKKLFEADHETTKDISARKVEGHRRHNGKQGKQDIKDALFSTLNYSCSNTLKKAQRI